MKAMLLAINPEHVNNIFNGTKTVEYRKVPCKSDVDRMVIYCTSPVKKVVGEARIQEIIQGTPEQVWEQTQETSGISREFFDEYYSGRDKAIAYRLSGVTEYSEAMPLETYGLHSAPQSFVYVDI